MIVETITAEGDRKTGHIAVTFTVSPEVWQAMQAAAKAGMHRDTADYVAATINTAFLDQWPDPEGPVTARAGDGEDDIPF